MTQPSFDELGVAPFFAGRLLERQITGPTDIQSRVIPPLMEGHNVLFSSATGTGKTFAYLLPLLQGLLGPAGIPAAAAGLGPAGIPAAEPPEAAADPPPKTPGTGGGRPRRSGPAFLICAPTYELCSQIKGELDFLLPGALLKTALLIGSASVGRQIEGLKKNKPAVVVGNPGRLLQLARMGKLSLGNLRYLVLDEGDRLTADELVGETRELMALVNRDRLTAACSATIPPPSRDRLLPLLGEDVRIESGDPGEALRDRIEHWAILSEDRRKIGTLRSFLGAAKPRKTLVFIDRAGQVGNILAQLQYHHFSAAGLYGDMDQRARKQALEDFRLGKVSVLVTSDLAARGLDIAGVSHVVALDVPQRGEPYIHRAGRTARAGRRGVMVTIGDEGEMRRLAALEKKLGIAIYPKELYGGRIYAPAPES
jgi:superfamily II DNA/RNA helicase